MPRIVLHRTNLNLSYTLGELQVLGDDSFPLFTCYTLELAWADNKPRTSCVPAGRYVIKLEYSPAFRKNLWELKDVPGRSEIKIHAGNKTSQLLGCVAPGMELRDFDRDGIVDALRSAEALKHIHAAMGGQKVSTITIS